LLQIRSDSTVYAPNKPEKVPFSVLVGALLQRILSAVVTIHRFIFVLALWGLFVPLFTTWMAKFFLGVLRFDIAGVLLTHYWVIDFRQWTLLKKELL
jgi:hypothetical protein